MLERVQKRCLRVVYGYTLTYEELLKTSGLERLQTRRQNNFEKFANKTLTNPKYSHWFPLKTSTREVRHNRPYLEITATGQRLYRSPMYAMRRYLSSKKPVECTFDDLMLSLIHI